MSFVQDLGSRLRHITWFCRMFKNASFLAKHSDGPLLVGRKRFVKARSRTLTSYRVTYEIIDEKTEETLHWKFNMAPWPVEFKISNSTFPIKHIEDGRSYKIMSGKGARIVKSRKGVNSW